MKTSKRGLDLIKKYEGCRLKAYKCPAGVWTIGWGHTAGVKEGQTITQEQADAFLVEDVKIYEDRVNKYSKYNWNQNQFDALVSFAYNIGSIDQLTSNGRRSIKTISEKIPAYCNANGKPLEGLKKRRAEEKALFDEPVKAPKTEKEDKPTNSSSKSKEGQNEASKPVKSPYIVGKTYTIKVRSALNVRKGAGKQYKLVGYYNLTPDGRKHANRNGALYSGTKVTVKEVKINSPSDIWVRIPSGWISAVDGSKTFVV